MKDFIKVKVLRVVHWQASHWFGFPVRMSTELQDQFNGCLFQDDRVEWSATKEGLHPERLQITKPIHWILAQKLHQWREKQIDVTVFNSNGRQWWNQRARGESSFTNPSEQKDESRAEGLGQDVRKVCDLLQHGTMVPLCRHWKLSTWSREENIHIFMLRCVYENPQRPMFFFLLNK